MELSASQTDALAELINIGYARAAGALSDMTGHRIHLSVPQVAIRKIESVAGLLQSVVEGEVISVNQNFAGPITGNALLMLDMGAALLLNQLLTDRPEAKTLDAAGKEVITEVGNILLNACLGVFGNLLHVQLSFAVPNLFIEALDNVMQTLMKQQPELRFALLIHTRFHMKASNVSGYMIIILGISSLERLMMDLQKWEQGELS
ncbi:MAG: chemotaxis protein CheC [Verrucomicrobiales bacterium]